MLKVFAIVGLCASLLGFNTTAVAQSTPINVSLINASFSGNPTGTTYQAQAYAPAFTNAATGALVGDAAGNLYVAANGGSSVQQIKPDGTAGMQWTGLSSPGSMVIAKDGSGLLVGTSAGLIHLGFDGSHTQLNTNTDLGWLAYSPSGVLFNVSYGSSTIYRISDTWQVSTFLASGVINHPSDFTFDDAGNMIVAGNGAGQIIQVSPSGTVRTLLSLSGVTSVARYGTGWLIGSSSNVYLTNAQWQTPTSLVSSRADQFAVTPNGKVFFAAGGVTGIHQLVPVPAVGTASGYNQLAFDTTGNLLLGATVQDGNAPVSQVQFFNGTTSLGIVTQPPYTYNWNNIAPGSYSVTAKSTDSAGNSGTSPPIAVTVSSPITLGSPNVGQTLSAPTNLSFVATVASTVSASITQVAFFNGTTALGTVTQAPYTFNLSNAAAGTYHVTAVMTSSTGASFTSNEVDLTVAAGSEAVGSLTVTSTSPASGQTIFAPGPLVLSVDAVDTGASVTQVAFYNGTALLGTVSQAPYTLTLNNLTAGTYNISAQATDSLGQIATTSPVGVSVINAPPVNVSPINVSLINAGFSGNPTGTTYQAQAYAPSFTNAANGALVGDAAGNLYVAANGGSSVQQIKPDGTAGMQWTGLSSPGSMVIAKDGSGLLVGTSAGLIHLGFDGSHTQLNTNTDLGWLAYSPSGVLFNVSYGSSTIYRISDTWQVSTFLASGVINHPSDFTFDDAGNMIVAGNGAGQIIQVSPSGTVQTLLSLSGVTSVARYGTGWLIGSSSNVYLTNAQWQTPTSLVSSRADQFAVTPNGKVFFAAGGVTGIHQLVPVPAVGTASGYNQLAFDTTGNLLLGATVQDGNAPVSQVQFFNGTTSLGIVTQPPYTYNWNNIAPGSYSVTAKSTDSAGNSGTSPPIAVTVSSPITLGSPNVGQTLSAPTNLRFAAAVTSTVSASVTQVAFFNGATLLGVVTQAPYTFNLSNAAAGTYHVTAVMTSSTGASFTSNEIDLTVASSSVTVGSLTVTRTSPASGQTVFAPGPLVLSVDAVDTGASVTQVAFYNGTALLGTVSLAPYTLTLNNLTAGTYNISAQVTDSLGQVAATSPASVAVIAPVPVIVNLINASFSGAPTGTTYQVQAYAPAFTGTANGDLIGDAAGNLYVAANGGSSVQQIKSDGTAGMQWTGLSSPGSMVIAKDGSGLLVGTSIGLMHLGFDGSVLQLNSNTDLGSLGYSPSGVLFNVSYASGTIYQISDSWQVSTFLPSGTIYHPAAFTFDDAGNMIVAANGAGQIIQVSPSGSLQTLLNIGGAVSVARYGAGWLVGSTNGAFMTNAQWQTPKQLASGRADQFVVTPNGNVFFTAWGVAGIHQLIPVPSTSTASGYNQLAFQASGSVMLGATVQDGNAPVSQVQFFNGNTLLGTVTQPPYTFNWNNIPGGSYSITAKSTDSLGVTGTSVPLNLTVNAPTISLTSPTANQTMTAPATITMSAIASSTNGTIAQVQLYNGTTLLATVTKPPYTFTLGNLGVGSYRLSASATDSNGVVSSTPAVTISVPLTATMTSPVASQTWIAPVTIPLAVTASSGAGSITQVAFYNGSTPIGVATQSPFTMNWNNVPVGTYPVSATITDSAGNVASTSPVNVSVTSPVGISITSPTNGSQVSGKNFTLTATATVSNASINQVAFYNGPSLIATTTQAPYTIVFPELEPGSYSFTAQATDSFGATATTTTPVNVTVLAASGGGGTGTGGTNDGVVYDIHTDQLNTPRLITDSNGNTVWQNDNTEAFGNSTPNESPNGGSSFVFNLRFPGQYYDIETGTHYNYFRDCYDPATGRYCESDPIGLAGGSFSTYAYVANNPLRYVDPDGLQFVIPGGGIAPPVAGGSSPGQMNPARPVDPSDPTAGTYTPSQPLLPAWIRNAAAALGKICSKEDGPSKEQCLDQCSKDYDLDAEECSAYFKIFGKKRYSICMERAGSRLGQCTSSCSGN